MSTDKKLFNKGADVLYDPMKSANILRAFNEIIAGLYHIGDEQKYIIGTLNTTTYVEAECDRLLKSIGSDLLDTANKLEMVRSLLFGECLNWKYIHENLEQISIEKKEKSE